MPGSDLPPVVFIHGWKASVLVDKKSEKVEYDYTLGMVLGIARDPALELPLEWESDGAQVRDNLVAARACHSATGPCGIKLSDVYGPVLDHLAARRDLHIFTYDWRRCLAETGTAFEDFLGEVAKKTGKKPQVVAHSMGVLVTVSVLNKRPDLFHSALLGAGAHSPNISVMKDYSLEGEMNAIVMNKTCFSPRINLSNPSAMHFFARQGERVLFGKPNTVLLRDAEGNPLDLDLHDIATWKRLKLGLFNPGSGVDVVTENQEKWLQDCLTRAKAFREGLLPENNGNKPEVFPPIGVLRGDHMETEFAYVVGPDGVLDFKEGITHLRGDGRITLEDALPPKGMPVSKIITNDREHGQVLNDLESVDVLLQHLVDEANN